MNELDVSFSPFEERMRLEGLPSEAIENFRYYYSQLCSGETGLLPEAEILPIEELPDFDHLGDKEAQVGRHARSKTILLKLNGGLGTSMGLQKAKSLLTVKEDLTFLDIIARQSQNLGLPLILMNSFATRSDSLNLLEKYENLARDLPQDFLQHKVPKIRRDDLSPAVYPQDPSLEWCPPGHGDIYTALTTTGTLRVLLEKGYRYAFVSNSDNLGADLDDRILGYFVSHNTPFMMEVADRTDADRKGGHLAKLRTKGSRLVLRESAQCPESDTDFFQNIERHRYFNTNNLWINLEALGTLLAQTGGYLRLSLIRNAKTVDPRDKSSFPVFQLETAMGAAVSVFEGAQALRVPRTRFSPVKTCDDLLGVRSDATVLDDKFRVKPNPARLHPSLRIELDPKYYRLVNDLEKHFPFGAPSLLECRSLTVTGNVYFDRDIVCRGDVTIEHDGASPLRIQAGSELKG